MARMITSSSLVGVMINTQVPNARGVGSNPALDAIFPISSSHTTLFLYPGQIELMWPLLLTCKPYASVVLIAVQHLIQTSLHIVRNQGNAGRLWRHAHSTISRRQLHSQLIDTGSG